MIGGQSPITSKGPLMPILTIAAVGLAGLVWIVPLPILRAPEPPAPPPAPLVEAPKPETIEPRVKVEEWGAIASALEGLREKAPEPATAETTGIEAPVAQVEPLPTIPPLGWQFKGTIDGPGSSAALVTLADGRSRFVFVGQRLDDPSNPGGPKVVILEVGTEYLLVSRGDVEEKLPLQKPELANPLSGRVSAAGMGR